MKNKPAVFKHEKQYFVLIFLTKIIFLPLQTRQDKLCDNFGKKNEFLFVSHIDSKIRFWFSATEIHFSLLTLARKFVFWLEWARKWNLCLYGNENSLSLPKEAFNIHQQRQGKSFFCWNALQNSCCNEVGPEFLFFFTWAQKLVFCSIYMDAKIDLSFLKWTRRIIFRPEKMHEIRLR